MGPVIEVTVLTQHCQRLIVTMPIVPFHRLRHTAPKSASFSRWALAQRGTNALSYTILRLPRLVRLLPAMISRGAGAGMAISASTVIPKVPRLRRVRREADLRRRKASGGAASLGIRARANRVIRADERGADPPKDPVAPVTETTAHASIITAASARTATLVDTSTSR